jgi:hypothetical protein
MTSPKWRKEHPSMPRSVKDFERYKVSATDGDLGSVAAFLREDTFWTDVEELSRHYAWLPGWAGCDRSIPSTPLRTPSGSASAGAAASENDVLEQVDAWSAAYEEYQIRAADEAVLGEARQGRVP